MAIEINCISCTTHVDEASAFIVDVDHDGDDFLYVCAACFFYYEGEEIE